MHVRLFAAAAAAAALAMAGAASASAADNAAVMAVIHAFADAFNTGKPIDPYLAPGPQMVIDDVPPHHWSGPGAIKAWSADLAVAGKRGGLTDAVMKMHAPSHIQQDGAHAYVVLPSTFSFKIKGKPGRDEGALTVALDRYRSGWKIAGFAWSADLRH